MPAKNNPSPATMRNPREKAPKLTAVSVYQAEQILSSSDFLHLIKGLKLTGCAVISKGVLVVEGGTRAVNKFNKLVTAKSGRATPPAVVWQGKVWKPSFGKFSVLHCASDSAARKFFLDHGVSQYWDLAVVKFN